VRRQSVSLFRGLSGCGAVPRRMNLDKEGRDTGDRVLRRATQTLNERFGIEHATVQVEPPDYNIVLQFPRSDDA
jgi:hypothetical protein